MGVPESSGSQQTSAMKIFFFALAVLAAYAVADAVPNADANADADADAWYRSYYGHGLGHYGYRDTMAMARDLLMLSPLPLLLLMLMLMPMLGTDHTMAMVLDIEAMVDTMDMPDLMDTM